MNFLMRSTSIVYSEHTQIPEPRVDVHHRSQSAGSYYESHKPDVPYSKVDLNSKHHDLPIVVVDKHIDVSEEEGWITIACSMYFLHSIIFLFVIILLHCFSLY
jgi:hypothetical protein